MPMVYDMLYFILLVTIRFKNYWSRIDLYSVSPGVIIALQERHMKYIMILVLTR